MREFISIVEAAEGEQAWYWITADGRVLDCSGWSHEGVASREFDMEDNSDDERYEASVEAHNHGWIRVRGDRGGELGADWQHTTPEARAALRKLIGELAEFEIYYINDGEEITSKKLAMAKVARLTESVLGMIRMRPRRL